MFFFLKEEIYIGFSIEELAKVLDILDQENMKYTIKVNNPSGQWIGPGTMRGNVGSFGLDSKYEKQYSVFVKKKGAEHAKYLVHRALHT